MPKTIKVEQTRLWDESAEQFILVPETTFTIEHSLISVSLWESKWKKPFIDKEHTIEEMVSYIECMCMTKGIPSYIFRCLPASAYKEIADYIIDPMTATRITKIDSKKTNSGRDLTNELIYYYMFAFGIPKDCEKWHINRLIKLIEVCDEMSKPPKKMTPEEQARLYSRLNNQRRAALHSRG